MKSEEVPTNGLFIVGRTRLVAADYNRLADQAVNEFDMRPGPRGSVSVLVNGDWDTSAAAFNVVAVKLLGNQFSAERTRRLRLLVLDRLS